MSNDQKLGATGRFPEGKLNENDEGELRAGITIHKGKMVINFGKPVTWLALSKKEVEALIELLSRRLPEL